MEHFFGAGTVLAVLFGAAGYTVYSFIRATHLERMAKIEKGMDTSACSKQSKYAALKIGLLMIGIAIGLLLAYILEVNMGIKGEVLYPSFMLLFGGISLVFSFFWVKKMSERE